MPAFNRRSFLHMVGAAGLAPALPPLPARAAASASGGATTAQMLWASLQARAGNPVAFEGVARTMGISGTAAQGIYAKALQTHALSAQSATVVRRLSRQTPTPQSPAPVVKAAPPKREAVDLEKLLTKTAAPHEDDMGLEPTMDADSVETRKSED